MKDISISTTDNGNATRLDPLEMIEMGQYYWLSDDHEFPQKFEAIGAHENFSILCCVTHIGSNYIELTAFLVDGFKRVKRIHIDNFFSKTKFEPNPMQVVEENKAYFNQSINDTLEEMNLICSSLDVHGLSGPSHNSNSLISINNGNIENYEDKLVCAKDELLPKLQGNIETFATALEAWVSYETLKLSKDKSLIKKSMVAIDDRLYNLRIYAGIGENVTWIKKGNSAIRKPINVMQRMCYMDEESLIDYDGGGMEFKDITDFDRWLKRTHNFERIFPFEKTIVAFRVRRDEKHRESETLLGAWINVKLSEIDKSTFLYVRNGGNLYRIQTDFHFGQKLFPDADAYGDQEEMLISNSSGKIKFMRKANWEALHEQEFENKSKIRGVTWERFNSDSVYYDDAISVISSEINDYNKIVLIIQGLIDRSETLNPLPKINLSNLEDFNSHIKLIYDDYLVLNNGEKPDFKAYQEKCNASIKTGSIVVGQRLIWQQKRYEEMSDFREYAVKPSGGFKYYRGGDEGVDKISSVQKVFPRKGEVQLRWEREKLTQSNKDWWEKGTEYVEAKMNFPIDSLLNIDAYKKGDYKLFFDDPRTRKEYLKWAYLLLSAEDYVCALEEKQKL